MVTNPPQHHLCAKKNDDWYYLMVVKYQKGNPERHYISLPKPSAEKVALILEATTDLSWELEERSEE